MTGFRGLLLKEILRFWRVYMQTIVTPVLATVLYLLVFSHAISPRVTVYESVNYTAFLIPGLIIMSIIQNSFANSSSSLIQSKLAGNLILILLPPISPLTIFCAYTVASVIRGLVVGVITLLIGFLFEPSLTIASPLSVLLLALLVSVMAGSLGIVAGLWAEKFDQMGMFNGFIIVPMTFLSGVFYSVHSLPPFWKTLSYLNPFFYMVDGFRYSFFNAGDTQFAVSFLAIVILTLAVSALAIHLLMRGYKIRL